MNYEIMFGNIQKLQQHIYFHWRQLIFSVITNFPSPSWAEPVFMKHDAF